MSAEIVIDNVVIRQDSKGRYCLNDLHRAAGDEPRHQPAKFLRLESTGALVDELRKSPEMDTFSPVETMMGRAGGTYVVRELVYAYAMWVSAAFHLKVIRTFDMLVSGQQPEAPLVLAAKSRPALLRQLAETAMLAADLQERVEKQEAQLAEKEAELVEARPAAALGKLITPEGYLWSVTEAARILRVERDNYLFPMLRRKRWVSREGVTGLVPFTCAPGGWAYMDWRQRGTHKRSSGQEEPNIVWGLTAKGLRRLGELLGREREVEEAIAKASASTKPAGQEDLPFPT